MTAVRRTGRCGPALPGRDRAPAGRRRRLRRSSTALALLLPTAACARAPMAYLTGFGTKNYPVVSLLWGLLIISLLVVVIVAALVLVGMFRSRATPASGNPGDVPLERSGSGLTWVYAGTAASALALLGAAAWTFNVLGAVSVMPGKPALTIHVIGHQWWWEFRYEGDDVSRSFTTANEIHIPTGQPVRIEATSTDVIHSFWVPTLSGKMDTIPNQHNETWIEADTPGTYRGQCTEFCGQQHAHMALIAIADPPDKFKAWWDDQLKPAPAPPSDTIAQGRSAFVARCGVCHAVRGSIAQGRLGPDLSHLMSRSTIAAGTLPNTVGYLSGWIADPQHAKPGNLMPELDLSGPELTVIRRYLETLK